MSSNKSLEKYNVWLSELTRPTPKAVIARDPTARLGYGSCTGWFTSRKCRVRWPFESLLERDAFVVLEADRLVESYAAQPETFFLRDRRSRYTPDLMIRYADGSKRYREVKPATRVETSHALTRDLSEVRAHCVRRNASFDVWTDLDIRREPRLSNSHWVTQAAAFVTRASLEFIVDAASTEGLTLDQAIGRYPHDPVIARSAILGLVGLGLLHADLEHPLTGDTLINWASACPPHH